MAKTATRKSGAKKTGTSTRARSSGKPGTAVVRRASSERAGGGSTDTMGEAFINLLQSPFVAELVAVAATAALASLAEHGFTSSSGASRGKRAGRAVKAAGKAAAAAVGRRLANEIEDIREAAKESKAGAKA